MHAVSNSQSASPVDREPSSLAVASTWVAGKVLLCVCGLILVAKLILIWRININWDEFYYLTHVFEASRSEVTRVFQQAYVHLFQWLPGVGENEIDQVRAGRIVAWILLVASAALITRLAMRWVEPRVAWIAPLAYLAARPVLHHGASFRSDSWLTALCLLTLLVITASTLDRKRILAGGTLFGLSIAVSLKAVLMAPIFVAFLIAAGSPRFSLKPESVMPMAIRVLQFSAASIVCASILLFFHWLTLPDVDSNAIGGFAANAAQKTLLDVPLFPRWDYLKQSLDSDWVSWLLVAFGFLVAVAGKNRRAALFALSLAPLIFYRNAFPYYYVVMLAPAAVLAAVGIDWLAECSQRRSGRRASAWLPLAVSLPLIFQAVINIERLRFPEQEFQQLTIEAVHEIFPDPVPYVDHSGMVASFEKVNFFMSSWGLENYRQRGVSFMEQAIAQHRPPMVLANASVLMPVSDAFGSLLERDRELIENFYLPYWGAIRIAGAEADLSSASRDVVQLPFPGNYRVETDQGVTIDGRRFADGDVLELSEDNSSRSIMIARSTADPASVRLVWAEARPAPPGSLPPYLSLYRGL